MASKTAISGNPVRRNRRFGMHQMDLFAGWRRARRRRSPGMAGAAEGGAGCAGELDDAAGAGACAGERNDREEGAPS